MSEQTTLKSEVLKIMQHMQFKESSINHFLNHDRVKIIETLPPELEIGILKLYFSCVINNCSELAEDYIRLGITFPKDNLSWLDSMTSNVLPFLKANENHYFL